MIGPYDLSGSMGIVGDFKHSEYKKNLNRIKQSAIKNKIKTGIHVVAPELSDVKSAIKENYSLIAYSTDALLIFDRCKNDLKTVKNIL